VEIGTDSKQINRIPQHYIGIMPHMTDPAEYSDSPSKALRAKRLLLKDNILHPLLMLDFEEKEIKISFVI
jgi:hypothetical protein